jgi:DNA-binding SARP family transcriptional activator
MNHAHHHVVMVIVRVLGHLEVLTGATPIPSAAWQSRKARELLLILVARRGRAVSREELTHLLWPDDASMRAGHRLSNLLSLIRAVLSGPKIERRGEVVKADRSAVSLDPAEAEVDVDVFLTGVADARAQAEAGDPAKAMTLLVAVEGMYRGDPFDDMPYAGWAQPLREEARAGYISGVRVLARLLCAAGDTDRSAHYLLRLLAKDPYDEDAHRSLVEALSANGRHGEARRAFIRYTAAMREIDVTPPDATMLTRVVALRRD